MPDGIVLVGMPTVGKSTVGRLVAERSGRPFVDTDEVAARRLGMPVAEFIARHGVEAYRAAESEAVAEAARTPGAVIATGGGAVLDPLNRWTLWHHGTVAWLDLEIETLVERLRRDTVARPTLQPYRTETVRAALEERAPMYRAADLRLDARADSDALADRVPTARAPRSRRLFDAGVPRPHPIGPPTSRVVLGIDIVGEAPPGVAVLDRRLGSATPELVAAIPARACLAIAAGERAKRVRRLEAILDWLAAERVERETPLLAVGGGTIGDLAGTAAALYARGLPLVHVPTTWLAQADSAIGGKVAVDLAATKNAVGAFWPPVAVLGDLAALRSVALPVRRDGMAESVKAGLIGDPALFRLIEDRGRAALRDDEAARYAIVERSARLKLAVCARDPFEAGERRTLNLGHTVGHALEVESGYRLRHGAAVALGLRAAMAISVGRGADRQLSERLDALLASLGFDARRAFDAGRVRAAMLGDKKRRDGRQRWILPMEVGRVVEVDDVTDGELDRALRTIGPA